MKKQKGGTKIEDKQKNKSKRNSRNYSYSLGYNYHCIAYSSSE